MITEGLTNSLFIVFVLSACICLEDCRAKDTITVAEPIQDPETIVSSGQRFKLGFFSPVKSTRNRYVGIMFNTPEQVVVWVANRDRPVKDSSGILTISGDGNLVVLNGQKEILWSSNVLNSLQANSSAQLLDTGNLVLRDSSNGTIVWESFQIPTDTFLRGMRIGISGNEKIQLTSWKSPSDPSIGSFSFGVDPLLIPELFLWNNESKPLWRSGPWNGNVFIGIPGMNSSYQNRYELVTDGSTGSTTFFTYTYDSNSPVLLSFVLSSSGSLEQMDSFDGKGEYWNIAWSSRQTECDVYGKCGPFGLCNPKSKPICTCLQGFEPRQQEEWNRGNWSGGCSRKVLLQCDRNRNISSADDQTGKSDKYLQLTKTKAPDFSHPISITEEECANRCLNNCSCVAYTFSQGLGCLHWNHYLIDTQQFPLDGIDLYIRVAYSELDYNKSNNMKAVITSTVLVGSLLLSVSAYFFFKWFTKQHRGNEQEAEPSLFEAGEAHTRKCIMDDKLEQSKLQELPLFSYETLANATHNFHSQNNLGKGGFGPVYKGKLLNGQEIAVKKLSSSSSQGIKEFMNEVVVISKLQHRNLVRLLGCCVEREEKMIVYEYMPHKSLDAYLFDSRKQDFLDWNRRCVIIEGIGRGLLYLHRDSRLKIIHRDLKASNILLDKDLNPKISDFGLARIFGSGEDQANTNRVVGTYGYMAPEYAMRGKFSEKSDVYSFGVLLLEIISGKRNTSFYHDENDISLLGHAWKMWNKNETAKLVDQVTFHPDMEREVLRYVHIGLLCVQDSAKDRPNVSTVLSMLNSELGELPHPKLPAYTATLGSSKSECSQQRVDSVNNVSLTTVQGR